MQSDTPAISVIMAVRNGEPYLEAALQSLAGQSFGGFEVIIVDNGSRDGTPALLADWARRDPRFRIFQQPRPGLARTLAFAVGHARAPLLARLDSDDLALPERLAIQHAFMAAHPDVGLAGSWVELVSAAGARIAERQLLTGDTELRSFLLGGNPFVHSAVIMRRAAYDAAGGYRVGLPICEDFDLWTRMAPLTRLANIDRVLVRYRVHSSGLSSRYPARLSIADACIVAGARARGEGGAEPFENGHPKLRSALTILHLSRAEFRYRIVKNLVTATRMARFHGHRDLERRLRRRALGHLGGMAPGDLLRGATRILASYFDPHTRLRLPASVMASGSEEGEKVVR